MIKKQFLFTLLIISANCIFAQQRFAERTVNYSVSFLQIKEGNNFGLAFKGPGINFGQTWNIMLEKGIYSYEYQVGLGTAFSKEMIGARIHLKPLDIAYMFTMHDDDYRVYLGPRLNVEYNYMLYPDLQSGFDFWLTDISLHLQARLDFNMGNSDIRILLSNSLAGFTSRQDEYRDPYFYDIGLDHAIRHLHTSLKPGSFNRFNLSELELIWKKNSASRIALSYTLHYYGYFEAPQISMINHSIKLAVKK